MNLDEEWREELEIAFAAAEDELRTLPAEFGELALKLLGRSNPLLNGGRANRISYLLPYWVGENVRAPIELCRELAIGNLFAMLHFFVLDDAIDGDAGWSSADRRRLLPLGQLLHGLFYRKYLGRFPASSPAWDRLSEYMKQWAAAMAREADSAADPRDFRALAGKAAPVKLCAAALLLEAGRPDRLPALDEAVDLTLATLQLSDDYADWREDLAEPDGNAFLTLVRELLGEPDGRGLDEKAVSRALYHRGALGKLAKLAEDHGAHISSIPECPPSLLDFQRSMAEDLRRAADGIEDEVNRLLRGDRLSGLLANLSGG